MIRLAIERSWAGAALPPEQVAHVEAWREGASLIVTVDAPYFGDTPPAASVGATDGLWNHEVVELFLGGRDERYLEIELGPHGHHLVLELDGVRQPARSKLPIEYRATIVGDRFHGRAVMPAAYLPSPVTRANAYAIHGEGSARTYCAHASVPGIAPDFHRLDCFVPCVV